MLLDQPFVDYGTSKKNSKRSMIATKKEEDEMNALNEAWEKKRKGRSFVGQKISLSEFMAKKPIE